MSLIYRSSDAAPFVSSIATIVHSIADSGAVKKLVNKSMEVFYLLVDACSVATLKFANRAVEAGFGATAAA